MRTRQGGKWKPINPKPRGEQRSRASQVTILPANFAGRAQVQIGLQMFRNCFKFVLLTLNYHYCVAMLGGKTRQERPGYIDSCDEHRATIGREVWGKNKTCRALMNCSGFSPLYSCNRDPENDEMTLLWGCLRSFAWNVAIYVDMPDFQRYDLAHCFFSSVISALEYCFLVIKFDPIMKTQTSVKALAIPGRWSVHRKGNPDTKKPSPKWTSPNSSLYWVLRVSVTWILECTRCTGRTRVWVRDRDSAT